MKKLGEYGHSEIDVSGCLFLIDLKVGADAAGRSLSAKDVRLAYEYAVPKFMREDCFINDHVEIIRIGHILAGGSPWTPISYLHRTDGESLIINDGKLGECNYFVAGVPYPNDPDGKHFIQTGRMKNIIWNPGKTFGKIVTFRGYRIGEFT